MKETKAAKLNYKVMFETLSRSTAITIPDLERKAEFLQYQNDLYAASNERLIKENERLWRLIEANYAE